MRYMKKTSTPVIIQGYIDDLRNALAELHSSIDEEIAKTLKEIARQKERLNDRAFEAEKRELERNLSFAMDSYYNICESQVRLHFTMMRETIEEWAAERPDSDLLETMKMYHDYGIPITPKESELLLARATGNYTAMKLLTGLMKSANLLVTDTPTLDQIEYAIDTAENEVITNVYAFSGSVTSDNKILGYKYNPVDYPMNVVYRAAVYLDDTDKDHETRLTALERLLAENTTSIDNSIELAPAKKAEIDALFADCPDEQARILRAKTMMDGSADYGYAFDALLKKYDVKLYRAALSVIGTESDSKLQELQHQKDALNAETAKTSAKAAKAYTELTKASMS